MWVREQELRDREQQQDAAATERKERAEHLRMASLKLMLHLPQAGAVLCLRLLLCLRETPKKGCSSGVSEGAGARKMLLLLRGRR